MEVKVRAENELYENNSKLDVRILKVIHFVENKLEEDLKQRIQIYSIWHKINLNQIFSDLESL